MPESDRRTSVVTIAPWSAPRPHVEDGLGSTTNLINKAGQESAEYSSDPSGGVTVTAPSSTAAAERINPFRYAGGIYDTSSDLIKFGQRWYDPDTGRFTQQDSLETLVDPTRANRYEYAGGNPVNYVDPTGRESMSAGGKICVLACLGVSYVEDESGDNGLQVSTGLGLGAYATVQSSSGDVDPGLGAPQTCLTVGAIGGCVSSDGTESGFLGSGDGLRISTTTGYTFLV